jgi:UDP-3-O-acyl N-acetylglucosamine deacetylase
MMKKQRTLKGSAQLNGIALHTGARATLKILPAEENSGIVFRRVDVPGAPEVRALASNVVEVQRGTTIKSGNAVVYTVEHVMSALHAYRIDNCIVEMDGGEPPICDGSALPYANLIEEAGIVEQNADAVTFTPAAPVAVTHGGTRVIIIPDPEKLTISCVTSFKGCPFDPQFCDYTLTTPESYRDEIAPGRTFVDYSDLRMLLAAGLCKGGSLDAAAIIHDKAIICKEGLRFDNEIVRHKILDCIGDLYLTGCRVTGTVVAVKPGHPMNVALATKLLAEMAAK